MSQNIRRIVIAQNSKWFWSLHYFQKWCFYTSNFNTNIVPWEKEVRNFQKKFPPDYILGFSRWDYQIIQKKVNLRGCLPQKLTSTVFFCLEFFPRRLQSGNKIVYSCIITTCALIDFRTIFSIFSPLRSSVWGGIYKKY